MPVPSVNSTRLSTPAAGADPLLYQRRGIRVILKNHLRPDTPGHFIPQRKVFERGQIVGIADHPLFKQDKAGHGNPDPRQSGRPQSLPQGDDRFYHVANNGFAAR